MHLARIRKSLSLVALTLAFVSAGYAGGSIEVSNVEQLYAAVNNASNAGSEVKLKDGTYPLSRNTAGGTARPNEGRLELQENMSLIGKSGNRSAVIINVTGLILGDLTDSESASPVGITGPVRIGRGANRIESLTIVGSNVGAGGIETDLAWPGVADLRIRNVDSRGSNRGIDVRNVGPSMAGRSIYIRIEDSDFDAQAQGIRIINQDTSGNITAETKGNYSHGNTAGCLIVNLRSSDSTIDVRSDEDRFDDNGAGCVVVGGLTTNAVMANSNSIVFEANQSSFNNNNGPFNVDKGGIVALGGESPTVANRTSDNEVIIRLNDSEVENNQGDDFLAFGARSVSSGGLAGTNNHLTIELNGDSRFIVVNDTASLPFEPAGTNKVSVFR